MTQYLARRIDTQEIEYGIGIPDSSDFEGPIGEPPAHEEGTELIAWQGKIPFNTAPTATCKLRWDGENAVWKETATLDEQRASKVADLSQACADAIFAGFASSALGEEHHYPANEKDQANLTGSVMRSFYPTVTESWTTPFWCADADGNWQFRPHTATQIQHVGDDAITFKLGCLGKNEALAQQVAASTTSEDIAAIVWQE